MKREAREKSIKIIMRRPWERGKLKRNWEVRVERMMKQIIKEKKTGTKKTATH